MSRTYRRKQGLEEDRYWVLRVWNRHSWSWHFSLTSISEHSSEGKRLIAVYHSDAQSTMKQVPSWYKKVFCNRPYRRKCSSLLHNVNEETMFPVNKKNAMYYW